MCLYNIGIPTSACLPVEPRQENASRRLAPFTAQFGCGNLLGIQEQQSDFKYQVQLFSTTTLVPFCQAWATDIRTFLSSTSCILSNILLAE